MFNYWLPIRARATEDPIMGQESQIKGPPPRTPCTASNGFLCSVNRKVWVRMRGAEPPQRAYLDPCIWHPSWVRAGPRRQDQLVPLSCAHTKIMRPWFVPNIFSGGRVRADPRRQDQLVPMGCAHTNIMRPWFVPNIYFLGAGYELIPGGRISSYPWVVHMQKSWDLGLCQNYEAGMGCVY